MSIKIMNLKNGLRPVYAYDFNIDRRSPISNPYPMGVESMRNDVCDKYEEYFERMLEIHPFKFNAYLDKTIDAYKDFGKLRLFCWCAPKRCHGITIKNYILENS